MSELAPPEPARVGVSACLIGERVRYDGGHKEHPLLSSGLRPWIELVPVCPEAELGLGTPREPIRLERAGASQIRLRAPGSGRDHTGAMRDFARVRVAEVVTQGLDGYVFKSRSPSCGLAVDLHADEALLPRAARGRFAEVVAEDLPELPLCEELDLEGERLRGFLLRVRCHAWLRQSAAGGPEVLLPLHESLRPELPAHEHQRLRGLLLNESRERYRRALLVALRSDPRARE